MAWGEILQTIGGAGEGALDAYTWAKGYQQREEQAALDRASREKIAQTQADIREYLARAGLYKHETPSGSVVAQQAGATERNEATLASREKIAEMLEGGRIDRHKTPSGNVIAQQAGATERTQLTLSARDMWERLQDSTRRRGQDLDTTPTGDGGGPRGVSASTEANIVNRLTNQWQTQSKAAQELDRAIGLMDSGLEAARRGDMAAGSQAVLVTFQKVLDPTSVVRESEYARSASGQAFLSRIRGAVERIQKGGAGVPLDELEKFARLAREAAEVQGKVLGATRERIGRTADRYRIPRNLVLEDEPAAPVETAPAPPSAPAGGSGISYQDYLKRKRGGR